MATTPEGLQTVTLVGQYVATDDAGTPQQGNLTFTPSPGLITFPTQNVMVTGTQTVTLDGTGSFTLDLVCTDTTGQNPTGWTYAVVEKIVGNAPRNFNIFLPYTVAVVNLADITPTNAAPTYLPVTGPQGPPGVITTINGYSAATVNLSAADVNAVATSAVGVASGVAGLDSGAHVVAAQLAFASATPVAVTTAGAVGTGTLIARNDHSHPGVDLTSAQTIAGVKTFSSSPIGPDPTTSTQLTTKNYSDTTYVALAGAQTVAGVKTFSSSPIAPTPTTATQVAIKSYVDGASTFTGTKFFSQASGGSLAITTQATGDTVNEFQIAINGQMSWGSGAASTDCIVFRETANTLATTNTGLRSYRGAASNVAFSARVAADTQSRWSILADGTTQWGPGGSTVIDTTLFRSGAAFLATNGRFATYPSTSTSTAQSVAVAGDANDRYSVRADGLTSWGPGTAAVDTNLYRASAGILQTDSQFQVNASVVSIRAASTNPAFRMFVTGDTVDRLAIRADGQMSWGPGGSTAADTVLARTAAGKLTLTGQLVTTGIGQTFVAYKVGDTSRTSTTTNTNDPDLTIAIPGAGVWEITAYFYYSGAGPNTGDMIAGFYYTGTVTAAGSQWSAGGVLASNLNGVNAATLSFNSVTQFGADGTLTPIGAMPVGVLTCSTSGTLTVSWAQRTSNATATIMKQGSWMRATQIA